jgi:hypothetical protein
LAQWLQAGAVDVVEIPDGYALHLDRVSLAAEHVDEFVSLERQCCPFLRLAVRPGRGDDGPVLEVGGGDEIKAFVAAQFGIRGAGGGTRLLRFPSSVRRDPDIEAWMHEHPGALGAIAQRWFEVMRGCGDDVRELLHDGHPTACVGDAAFAYVNAFRAHVNVGFFRGAEIADPGRLLEGTGKFMRHVKLGPERQVDATALMKLIETAYADIKARLETW